MRAVETVRTTAEIREVVEGWRARGLSVGLVPTMGAIHAGHLALVEAADRQADRVIVSLFVNPRQFGPGEDLSSYPRDEAADATLLAGAGADLLFAPGVAEVYPEGFATTIAIGSVTEGLCGAIRPGHFDGVATVLAKLFNMVGPDFAWFGEKDYQQLQVVRRLVRDLDLPVAVHGVATVREPDGLALSSRNAYLSPVERRAAPALHATLKALAQALEAGAGNIAGEIARAADALRTAGFDPVEYVAAVDAQTLAPLSGPIFRPGRALAAARLGRARLIDNVAIAPPPGRFSTGSDMT